MNASRIRWIALEQWAHRCFTIEGSPTGGSARGSVQAWYARLAQRYAAPLSRARELLRGSGRTSARERHAESVLNTAFYFCHSRFVSRARAHSCSSSRGEFNLFAREGRRQLPASSADDASLAALTQSHVKGVAAL